MERPKKNNDLNQIVDLRFSLKDGRYVISGDE